MHGKFWQHLPVVDVLLQQPIHEVTVIHLTNKNNKKKRRGKKKKWILQISLGQINKLLVIPSWPNHKYSQSFFLEWGPSCSNFHITVWKNCAIPDTHAGFCLETEFCVAGLSLYYLFITQFLLELVWNHSITMAFGDDEFTGLDQTCAAHLGLHKTIELTWKFPYIYENILLRVD